MLDGIQSLSQSSATACRSRRAGSAARARRCCCCTAIRKPMRCGTGSRPRWRSTSRVVLMDLRGYGDSARPAADAAAPAYTKREMALDALAVMTHSAFDASRCWRTTAARAWRTAWRRTIPTQVERMMLLDIAPTLAMYEQHPRSLRARLLALVLPDPAAAAARGADRVRPGALRAQRDGQAPCRPGGVRARGAGRIRALRRHRPARPQAMCEDYRASASIDLEHDRADVAAGRRLEQPLRVLWGEHGAVGALLRRAGAVARARQPTCPAAALPCGHYIAEEAPALLLDEALQFFSQLNLHQPTEQHHMSSKKRIAVIAGDGIGKEVMPEGIRVHGSGGDASSASTCSSTTSIFRAGTIARSTARCCPTTGRTRSAATTRSTSAPSAGPRRLPTTCRCGARCCCSAASSTSTSTCGPRA